MARILLLVWTVSNLGWAETPPDYQALFQKHVQFPKCLNDFEGVFESTRDGCFQIGANLILRSPSPGQMTHELALRFCENIDRLALRKGLPGGWRLPKFSELRDVHKDLAFVANNSGLDMKTHSNTGLGILPFDLNLPLWLGDTTNKSGFVYESSGNSQSASLDFVHSYSIATDKASGGTPSSARRGTFNYRDGGSYVEIKLETVSLAHALCVRTAAEGELPEEGSVPETPATESVETTMPASAVTPAAPPPQTGPKTRYSEPRRSGLQ